MNKDCQKSLYYQKCQERKNKLIANLNSSKLKGHAGHLMMIGGIAVIALPIILSQTFVMASSIVGFFITLSGVAVNFLQADNYNRKTVKKLQLIIEDYENGETLEPHTHLKVFEKTVTPARGYSLVKIPFQDLSVLEHYELYQNDVPVVFPKSEMAKPLMKRNFGEPILENAEEDFDYVLFTEAKVKRDASAKRKQLSRFKSPRHYSKKD